jgi:hypothetical protein
VQQIDFASSNRSYRGIGRENRNNMKEKKLDEEGVKGE